MPDYRPAYHLTPLRNWMNDPNGLVHHDGRWHVFFQHNPEGIDFGNLSWGHASSPDLVTWTEHDVALRYSADELVFSGSVVVRDDDTLAAIYTSVFPDGIQAQSLATSDDGGLTWTPYAGNPVLDRRSTDFRDPKVFPYDGPDGRHWVLVAVEAPECRVVFYRSDDLVDWTLLSEFGPAGPPAGHWECPDLFPLPLDGVEDDQRWVLVVSLNPGGVAGGSGTCWFVGDFDGTTFTAQGEGWLDWGPDNYAAVSFANTPGRRLILGWMGNWDYGRDVPTSPFRGAMTIPREVSLETVDGVPALVQRPARELAVLDVPDHAADGAVAYRLDLVVEPAAGGGLTVDLHADDAHETRLTWADGVLSLDRTRSGETEFHPSFGSVCTAPLPLREGRLRLEVYVDRCSVEVLAQDGVVSLTALVLPPEGATGFRLAPSEGTRVVELTRNALRHPDRTALPSRP